MNIKEKIINLDARDYHMHSSNYSDGLSTVDEIVRFAGEIGLKEIAITDHSQVAIDIFREEYGFYPMTGRKLLNRWENVLNDVNVIFGVEGDLLNEDADVCFDIMGVEPEFIILSAHKDLYQSAPETVTDSIIKAIEKYHDKIKFIGHPCNNSDFGEYIDIERLVDVANKYDLALEFNAKNLYLGRTNLEKLEYLLKNTNKIYLNSDAHTLSELKIVRPFAIKFLEENGYI